MTKDQLELILRRTGASEHDIAEALAQAAPDLDQPTAPADAKPQTVWERLGMTEEVFNKMSPSWRLTQAYQDPSHVVEDRQTRRPAAQQPQTPAPSNPSS